MLTLEPPFWEIGDISVYRDHAVPTQFYYTAPPPHIARAGGQLLFDLMAYTVALKHSVLGGTQIPDELGAGFLTMGVECALSDAQRADLLREVQTRAQVPADRIALYPAPYHKGTVSILALDKFTAPGQAPADPGSATPLAGRPSFVEQILGSGQPALLGALRAIFSLSLSQQGVVFLQGLYQERAAPVGVVYDLRFYGLRPAVDVLIRANLARVYEHFGGGLAVQYQWLKAEIQAGLDSLREHGDIQVTMTSQATGEAAEKSKELAMSLFRDQIIQEMFRPTAPAVPPAITNAATLGGLTGAPATTGTTGATTSAAGSGGAGGKPPAAPSLVALTLQYNQSHEDKFVEYHFSEQAPEERTHAPQGFLPVLLTPDELQQRTHQIALDSPFFELLEVLVSGPSKEEFDALGIRQVAVTLTYGKSGDPAPPESQAVLFRPDSTGDKTIAVKRRGRPSLAYAVALTYEFTRLAGADSDTFRYDLPSRSATGRSLLVNPYADFGVLDVEVEPGRLHPDVKAVDVQLAYGAGDDHFHAEEHFRLAPTGDGPNGATPTAARHHWQVRTREIAIRPYTAAYTFLFQDDTAYAAPPQTFTDPLLRVDTPFTATRELLIKPNPISPQVNQITVELEYVDAANNYRRHALVDLEAPFASVKHTWPLLDPNRQTVRYRVTVHEPGMLSEGDWEETADPSIIVGAVAHRVAKVQVQLVGPGLAEVGLDAVQIKVALTVPGAPDDEPQSVLLQPGQTSAAVDLRLPPGTTLRYRYQTTTFKSNGSVVEGGWKDMTSPTLVLSTRSL